MDINIISGGKVYGADGSVKRCVDDVSRLHAMCLEMAVRANVGRTRSYRQSTQWLDTDTDLLDADGAVLATVTMRWDDLRVSFGIRQVAEPSFIFA